MAPTFLSPDREAEFAARGYTLLRLFSADEALAIRDEALRRSKGELSANHGGIYLSFLDVGAGQKAALDELAQSALTRALEDKVTGGRLQNGGVIAKAPGAERLAIHHHSPVTDACFAREIVCWCPLTDVDESTGCLRVIPRSDHLLPYIRVPRGSVYFESFRAEIENYAVPVPLRAGEAILFDNTLLHGSAHHVGPDTRLAISVQIVPTSARNGIFLDNGLGRLDFVETASAEAFQTYAQTGVRPAEWETRRSLVNRNRPVTETEFRSLLSLGRKATENFDPLDGVRAEPVRRSSPIRFPKFGRS